MLIYSEEIVWWGNLTKYQKQTFTNEKYPHLSKIHGPSRAMWFLSSQELYELYKTYHANNIF